MESGEDEPSSGNPFRVVMRRENNPFAMDEFGPQRLFFAKRKRLGLCAAALCLGVIVVAEVVNVATKWNRAYYVACVALPVFVGVSIALHIAVDFGDSTTRRSKLNAFFTAFEKRSKKSARLRWFTAAALSAVVTAVLASSDGAFYLSFTNRVYRPLITVGLPELVEVRRDTAAETEHCQAVHLGFRNGVVKLPASGVRIDVADLEKRMCDPVRNGTENATAATHLLDPFLPDERRTLNLCVLCMRTSDSAAVFMMNPVVESSGDEQYVAATVDVQDKSLIGFFRSLVATVMSGKKVPSRMCVKYVNSRYEDVRRNVEGVDASSLYMLLEEM